MNIKKKVLDLFIKYLWILLLLIGIAGFLHIIFFLSETNKQEINSAWSFYYKIFIYIIICFGIALFPNKKSVEYLLLFPVFLVFLGFIIPRMGYLGFIAIPAAKDQSVFNQYYTMLFIILYPAITISIGFAYRIGGGTPGNTFKIAFGSQIILFSGYLDLLWQIINKVEFPDAFLSAHHIKIIIGHFPNLTEVIIFALCHIPILLVILLLPIDKWLKKLKISN